MKTYQPTTCGSQLVDMLEDYNNVVRTGMCLTTLKNVELKRSDYTKCSVRLLHEIKLMKQFFDWLKTKKQKKV